MFDTIIQDSTGTGTKDGRSSMMIYDSLPCDVFYPVAICTFNQIILSLAGDLIGPAVCVFSWIHKYIHMYTTR